MYDGRKKNSRNITYYLLLTVRKKEICFEVGEKFLLDFSEQWSGKLNEIKLTTNEGNQKHLFQRSPYF